MLSKEAQEAASGLIRRYVGRASRGDKEAALLVWIVAGALYRNAYPDSVNTATIDLSAGIPATLEGRIR